MTFRALAAAAALAATCALAAPPGAAAADGPPAPEIGRPVKTGVSPPLRDIVPKPPVPGPPRVIPNKVRFLPSGPGPRAPGADPARQTEGGPVGLASPTPAPGLSFEGTTDDDNAAVLGFRVVPPDTEGDVGPDHYVQMNNLVFEIFDKNGTSLLGPLPNNSLWAGFGGICETNNDGDPIVLYDQGADRWILSQFAIGNDGHQCVAVSLTGDPTGAYFLYDFAISPGCFNDYPKLGVWPDGYYLTANEFCVRGIFFRFRSAIAVAFEKPAMLQGGAARFVKFDIQTGGGTAFSVQPSHWEGPAAPAAGRPNVYVQSWDDETWGNGNGPDGYRLWEFAVDWASDTFSFTELGQADTAEFDANLCSFNPCVPQPVPGERLDTLSQFTMYRAHYRTFGTHEVLVVNHTVDADGQDTAGVRWAELRNAGSGWSVHQTGTYAPADGEHRWMGSANIDGSGNIALAFSLSSAATFPAVAYTSRAAADPAGEMSGGEVVCHAGAGSQTNSSNRWGDYSTLSVDPTDDCTFWLTNEYYDETASFDFKTRICAFTLADCGPAACDDGTCDAGETQCNCAADCGEPPLSEAGLCADGIDNDCDGLADCNDADCSGDPACAEPFCGDGVCDASIGEDQCSCATDCGEPPATETQCSDGIDNDCDGLIDSDDPDCPTCAPVGAGCTSDADCCSNKCRGRPGGKTCKS